MRQWWGRQWREREWPLWVSMFLCMFGAYYLLFAILLGQIR